MPNLEILEGENYEMAIERLAAEGASREDFVEFAGKYNDNVLDFDKMPKLQHNWHDGGEKLSCWDAGHPMHQVWKPRKAKRL